MLQQDQSRKKYPSDLTAEQGGHRGTADPACHVGSTRRAPTAGRRAEVRNMLVDLNRSGCQWDMLPHDLLPNSIHGLTIINAGSMTP
jgi:putative transposase